MSPEQTQASFDNGHAGSSRRQSAAGCTCKGGACSQTCISQRGAVPHSSIQGGGGQCAGPLRAVRDLHLLPGRAHAQALPPQPRRCCSCCRSLRSTGAHLVSAILPAAGPMFQSCSYAISARYAFRLDCQFNAVSNCACRWQSLAIKPPEHASPCGGRWTRTSM